MKRIPVKTTPSFDQKAKKLLTPQALEELFDYLEVYPEKGDLIQVTGGIRKLRWRTGKDNKGKSGGVRILYTYLRDTLVLLIVLYSKTEKDNITQGERNQLKQLLPQLISKYKEDL